MTPEREQYLTGISKIERATRDAIFNFKLDLSGVKRTLKSKEYKAEWQIEEAKKRIKNLKILLKLLKKQLPAPLKHELDDCICRCGVHYSRLDTSMMYYCGRCGQAIDPKTWHIPRNWQRVGK